MRLSALKRFDLLCVAEPSERRAVVPDRESDADPSTSKSNLSRNRSTEAAPPAAAPAVANGAPTATDTRSKAPATSTLWGENGDAGADVESDPLPGENGDAGADVESDGGVAVVPGGKRGMVLPFTPLIVTFDDVRYFVPLSAEV